MARSDKPGMIDGFMSVQAVRRTEGRAPDQKPSPPDPPQATEPEGTRSESTPTPKSRPMGHTAMPSRHELVCYSCGYAFVVTGKLTKLFCSKCREQLETGDHEIGGEWTKDIRTVGRVRVKHDAVVRGATIIATDIIVGGDCTAATLSPTRRIELETGAIVPSAVLDEYPIVVRAGARLSLDAPLRCSDLDIHGELQAETEPTGKVTIHPGGMFRGTLKAHHLIVHDGGGLKAKLHIAPAPPEEAAPKPKPKPKQEPTEATKLGAPKKPQTRATAARPKPTTKRASTSSGKKRASKAKSKKVE
jgi:cytoskeletal protein CcmA (bactofilin family)